MKLKKQLGSVVKSVKKLSPLSPILEMRRLTPTRLISNSPIGILRLHDNPLLRRKRNYALHYILTPATSRNDLSLDPSKTDETRINSKSSRKLNTDRSEGLPVIKPRLAIRHIGFSQPKKSVLVPTFSNKRLAKLKLS